MKIRVLVATALLGLMGSVANAAWIEFNETGIAVNGATNPGPINGAGGTGSNGRPNGNNGVATTAWLQDLTNNSSLTLTWRNDSFANGTIGGITTNGGLLTGLSAGFLVVHYGAGNTQGFGNSLVAYHCVTDCNAIEIGQGRSSWTFYGTPSSVPEPATLGLLGLGLAGVGFARRRRAA